MSEQRGEITFDDLLGGVDVAEEESTKELTTADELEAIGKESKVEAIEPAAEEEVEETVAEEKTEEPKTTKAEEPKPESDFLKLAKKYLEKGKWEDVLIDDGEGNEVALSELSDLDEEMFFQIQENQDTFKKEDIETNYISLKDVDERKKQVANIVLKGGDLKEIFKSDQSLERFMNPYKGLDLENEKVLENVYFNYLTKEKGYSNKAAQFELEEKKKELTLDTEVKDIIEDYDKKFQTYVKAQEDKLLEQEQKTREEEKEYKKNLSKVFKEKNLKEATARKYLDLATKKTVDGDYAIDSLYNEFIKDPERAADLIAFLDDKEGYLKRYKEEAKTAVTTSELKKMRIIKTAEGKKAPIEKKKTTNTNPLLDEMQMAE